MKDKPIGELGIIEVVAKVCFGSAIIKPEASDVVVICTKAGLELVI